ncbi:hypothetical protein [Shewanella sp.]|uniref:hypothetical protein n=1 Tax=Shewanella sp. TaxID=50422 RepID=UPI003A875077
MKRLFLTFGLVIAFLFTAQLSATTIFDTSTYQGPLSSSVIDVTDKDFPNEYFITTSVGAKESAVLTLCTARISTNPEYSNPRIQNLGGDSIFCNIDWKPNSWTTKIVSFGYNFSPPRTSQSCPPADYPNYSFERDTNNDGNADQCYNPDELDNASNCANQVGSMLPALTNLATRVCKTDTETGASCGYSKKDGDPSYQLDLEMNCFGDGEKVPEYDPEPMPQPETCAKVNDQLMVCKEKPEEKCDAMGNCQDQCGYVNKEFYCFIPCTGEDCDKPTPPVNCETNPDAPVCVEEPDPEFCAANPTDPKCTGTTPPDEGGETGGGGATIDLGPVVDQLKELNKKNDFTTQKNEGRKEFGAFDELFGEADLTEIKNMASDKKDEASTLINNIRDEFSGLFKVSSVGGSYEDLTLDFSYGSFHSKVWEFFQQNVSIIAAAIMALAWLIAASIVMGGRND